MIKTNFLILFYFIVFPSFSQLNLDTCCIINDSTITEGYYVVRFNKTEIISLHENRIREKNGESYALAVDVEQQHLFIPQDIVNNKNDSILSQRIEEWRTNKYYMIASNSVHRSIQQSICPDLKLRLNYPDELYSNIFYKINNNNKYLYKVYFIQAQSKEVNICKKTASIFLAIPKHLEQKNKKTFKLSLIYSINYSTNFPKKTHLEEWKFCN